MPAGVHLVFLLHGLFGSPANLGALVSALERTHTAAESRGEGGVDDSDEGTGNAGLELRVLLAKSYVGGRTWDGIDVNAWRAADELFAELDRIEAEGKDVVAFTITGYSLGGLIARALLSLVHARRPAFLPRAASAYVSIATPHAGIMRYATRLGGVLHTVGQRVFGRTGAQLYLKDGPDGACLLERMADPGASAFLDAEYSLKLDGEHMAALRLFPHIRVFANGCHDLTVPYPTAAVSHVDPFETYARDGVEVEVDADHVLVGWHGGDGTGERLDPCRVDARLLDDMGEGGGKPESTVDITDADTTGQTIRAALETPAPTRSRPFVPPLLLLDLPRPFRYLLLMLLPFIFPLWIMVASTTLFITSVQSYQRVRHHDVVVRNLLSALPDEPSETTPLLSAPALAKSDAFLIPSASPSSSCSSTPALSPALSRRGTHLPTAAQHRIITRLSLLPLERTIAWFPWAYNSHGTIIVRHRTFSGGDGVVRRWAAGVVGDARSRVRDRVGSLDLGAVKQEGLGRSDETEVEGLLA
ncbi:hypothetical protein Q5752_005866 [Cryptotrichosporon argae]